MAAASGRDQLIRHDEIKFNVVRLQRKGFDNLKAEREPNLDRGRGAMGKEAVEKTRPAAHPGAGASEGNARHEDNIDRSKDGDVVLAPRRWQNRDDFTAAPPQIRDQRRD